MDMDMNRFTEKLQEALRAAQSKATRYGHQQLDVEHLLAAPSGAGRRLGRPRSFRKRGREHATPCNTELEHELDRLPKVSGSLRRPPTRSTSRAA